MTFFYKAFHFAYSITHKYALKIITIAQTMCYSCCYSVNVFKHYGIFNTNTLGRIYDLTGELLSLRKGENDIPVVFCESTVSTRPAEQVARETGAAYGGVLYVDSLSEADGPVPTYLDLLRVTSETVAKGLTQ